MTDILSAAEFEAALARAGLVLNPTELAGVLATARYLAAAMALIRGAK